MKNPRLKTMGIGALGILAVVQVSILVFRINQHGKWQRALLQFLLIARAAIKTTRAYMECPP